MSDTWLLPRIAFGHYGAIQGVVLPSTLVEGICAQHHEALLDALTPPGGARPAPRQRRMLWLPPQAPLPSLGPSESAPVGERAGVPEEAPREAPVTATTAVHPLLATAAAEARGTVIVADDAAEEDSWTSECCAERRAPATAPYSVVFQLLRRRRVPVASVLGAAQQRSLDGGDVYDEWTLPWRPRSVDDDAVASQFTWHLVLRRRRGVQMCAGRGGRYTAEVHVLTRQRRPGGGFAPLPDEQYAAPAGALFEGPKGGAAWTDDEQSWQRIMRVVVEPLLELMRAPEEAAAVVAAVSLPSTTAPDATPWPLRGRVDDPSERIVLLRACGVADNVIDGQRALPPCLPDVVATPATRCMLRDAAARPHGPPAVAAFAVPRRYGHATRDFFLAIVPRGAPRGRPEAGPGGGSEGSGGGPEGGGAGGIYVIECNATLYRPVVPPATLAALRALVGDGSGGLCVFKCWFCPWLDRLVLFDVVSWRGQLCAASMVERRATVAAVAASVAALAAPGLEFATYFTTAAALHDAWPRLFATTTTTGVLPPMGTPFGGDDGTDFELFFVLPAAASGGGSGGGGGDRYLSVYATRDGAGGAVGQYALSGVPLFSSDDGRLLMLFTVDGGTRLVPMMDDGRVADAVDVMWAVARAHADAAAAGRPLDGQLLARLHWAPAADRYVVDAIVVGRNVSPAAALLRVAELSASASPAPARVPRLLPDVAAPTAGAAPEAVSDQNARKRRNGVVAT